MEKITFNLMHKGKQVVLNTMPASSRVRRDILRIQETYKSVRDKVSGKTKSETTSGLMEQLTDEEMKPIIEQGEKAIGKVLLRRFGNKPEVRAIMNDDAFTLKESIALIDYSLEMFKAIIDKENIKADVKNEIKKALNDEISNDFYQDLDVTEVGVLINSFCSNNSI